MPKYHPGKLVYINDDKKSLCWRVLSEELFESSEGNSIRVEPHLEQFFRTVVLDHSARMYEECAPSWILSSSLTRDEDKWLGRSPELPALGMFLKRFLVTTGNKTRHMACILGFDRKYLVPLHLLSPAKKLKTP